MAGRKGPALTEGPVTGEARGSGRARPPRDLVLKRAGVPEERQHTRNAQLRVTTLAQLAQDPLFRRRPIGHRLI